MTNNRAATYKDAGVDIDAGNRLVDRIKPMVKATARDGVLGSIGGFGGLFELATHKYQEPVLVSGTDGVGTKLRLAIDTGIHDSVGIDLVAMCVNDIVVLGAEPLFFLDYFGCGRLDEQVAAEVISGIAAGCQQAGAALIGGETAEMPGMYAAEDYDLAGFAVGVVEKAAIIDGSGLAAGDKIIGLLSSGPHSNGYSLIRKIVRDSGSDLQMPYGTSTLGRELLTPTRIYVKPVLQVIEKVKVKSIAHITGGGIPENLVRVLNDTVDARIDTRAWQRPDIFDWLQQQGNVAEDEMLRTFNCGIGMMLAVAADDVPAAIAALQAAGETALEIGEIVPGSGQVITAS